MNMNWQLIFNPFSKFSEYRLVFGGIFLTFLGTYVGFFCNVSYYGVLDIHLLDSTSFLRVLIENGINIGAVLVILFFLGKILNTKTRVIDIFNTALWYRLPIYLISLISRLLLSKDFKEKTAKLLENPESVFEDKLELFYSGFFALLTAIFAAYAIVLLTNGFRTATNIKKWQHFVLFAFALLLAEGVSKFFISII